MSLQSGERILDDSTFIAKGQFYIVDGIIRCSPVEGNVFDLKLHFSASEVRDCNVEDRSLGSLVYGEKVFNPSN